MSPLNISILLHYYTTPGDYRADVDPAHGASPAVYESMLWFVKEGLLSCRYGDVSLAAQQEPDRSKPALFKITAKGEAMVEHLKAVQIPICQWVQPPLPMTKERAEELTRRAT